MENETAGMEIEECIIKHNELTKKINALNEQLHALEKPMLDNFSGLSEQEVKQRCSELDDSIVKFEVFRRYLYKGPKQV